MFVGLLSCTWISPAEHARNLQVARPETSPETSEPPPPPVCNDDDYEPNDSLTSRTPLPLATEIDGALCPNSPVDLFVLALAQDDWLEVELTGDDPDCINLSLVVTDVYGGELDMSDCRRATGIVPAGDVTIMVSGAVPYTLSVSAGVCDNDRDNALDLVCGGDDCDDESAASYPGAVEIGGNGLDEDCDGSDDLAVGCPLVLVDGLAYGTAECGDPATDPVWDRWEIVIGEVDTLSIAIDTLFVPADLFAFAIGTDGTSHYGLAADGSQLDNDIACTGDDEALCPAACFDPGGPGTVTVWVAVHEGCQNDANYEFRASDGYEAIEATLVEGDVRFP